MYKNVEQGRPTVAGKYDFSIGDIMYGCKVIGVRDASVNSSQFCSVGVLIVSFTGCLIDKCYPFWCVQGG
jgi:hypothetical protein